MTAEGKTGKQLLYETVDFSLDLCPYLFSSCLSSLLKIKPQGMPKMSHAHLESG